MGNIHEQPPKTEQLVKNHRDITNPLLVGIKTVGQDIFVQAAEGCMREGVTPFDTSIQTMMHLAANSPDQVWNPSPGLDTVVELFQAGKYAEGSQLFLRLIADGTAQLNQELVTSVAATQAGKLLKRYRTTPTVPTYFGELNLASYLYDPSNSPFVAPPNSTERNSIVVQGGTQFINPVTGEIRLQAHEQYSGIPVNFQRISEETAQMIGDNFHYLHAYRPGVVSFGAFVDGDPFPFAMASFDNVNRGYKAEMLKNFGLDPSSMMELTRGWNGGWSPEGTMSVLLGHSHRELQRTGGRYRGGQNVTGILTAINPNLFGGAAFRAANFETVGHKPAGFTYMRESNGDLMYAPRWAIEAQLRVDREALKDHPQYCENGMPLFPTNEMLYLFDSKEQKKLGKMPVYDMDATSYNSK